jgi:hypothetical protein
VVAFSKEPENNTDLVDLQEENVIDAPTSSYSIQQGKDGIVKQS